MDGDLDPSPTQSLRKGSDARLRGADLRGVVLGEESGPHRRSISSRGPRGLQPGKITTS
jgi:hypothetical protein